MQNSKNKSLIYNIPCFLRDSILRKEAKKTLQRIRDRSPKDFMRLQTLVRAIQPYDDAGEGDIGIWLPELPDADDPATWYYGFGETPGILKIVENITKEEFPGILAHELGHAATREQDRERRGPISDEWRSELAADWYAYKWGFGRNIAKSRKFRERLHHGPRPGKPLEEWNDGKVSHYRVTRNFVAHLTKITRSSANDFVS